MLSLAAAVCRGDPAWKALYSLYNPDSTQGRATSLYYSLQNRQAIQRKVAARAAATAAAAATERAEQQQQKPSPKIKVSTGVRSYGLDPHSWVASA
jgi:hypothetical protein